MNCFDSLEVSCSYSICGDLLMNFIEKYGTFNRVNSLSANIPSSNTRTKPMGLFYQHKLSRDKANTVNEKRIILFCKHKQSKISYLCQKKRSKTLTSNLTLHAEYSYSACRVTNLHLTTLLAIQHPLVRLPPRAILTIAAIFVCQSYEINTRIQYSISCLHNQ